MRDYEMKTYQKDADYSYTLGVFPTIELLQHQSKHVLRVYLHSSSHRNQGAIKIINLCDRYHIPYEINDKTIAKLSKKDNCYAIGVFNKYDMRLENVRHVLLVNPGDMGNMGTILRTMLGFEYTNLAIVRPGVDVFDPKVIRASMGAIFSMNIEYFDDFNDYRARFKDHQLYTLMLKGATNIHHLHDKAQLHTLTFGNESSGLPDSYLEYGKSIVIPHAKTIDSLNLSMALGITLFEFSKSSFQ